VTETYIVCEGYHDRSFWSGALIFLGCNDPGIKAVDRPRVPVYDPWGVKVEKGQFGFRTRQDHFIRIVPTHGRSRIMETARNRIEQRKVNELHRLVICIDEDIPVEGFKRKQDESHIQDLLNWVKAIDHVAKIDGNDVLLGDTDSRVSLIRWRTADNTDKPGLPAKQTLERILCKALVQAFPDRAEPVEQWLAGRPDPPKENPKEHALSYLAGWFADAANYESAIRVWWEKDQIKDRLKTVLQETEIWSIMEEIADTWIAADGSLDSGMDSGK